MLNDKYVLFPAFEQNNIPVVAAVNNLFSPYAGVFIRSLLDYASEDNNYDIIIFEREISEENKRLLKSLVTEYKNVSLRFYDPGPFLSLLSAEKGFNPLPLTYYRALAPYILQYPGRIITIDVDTLLKTDIARLIDEDLGECCAGGVCDLALNGMHLLDHTPSNCRSRMPQGLRGYYRDVCGMDDLKNYVNVGSFLIDRDKYVRELEIETILDEAQEGRYVWYEQDALNVLLKGKIKLLDLAWDVYVPATIHTAEYLDAASKIFGEDYERAYENPYLIHWVGKPKPWVCPDVLWGSEWWQTALRTPFVGHIIARMIDEQTRRRAYYKEKYGKEVDVWDPSPKGIDRM